ncbi:MAG: glycosyltransferase family protein [Alphaproteobacteria bacterium]|nr:glycosyltransferase family protein [Alphaproteobacteria bacterium]
MTAQLIEQLWEISKRAFDAGNPQLADQINKVIFANNPSFRIYAELSKLLEKTGQYKSAADALRRALKIDPQSFDAWYQLGFYMYYHHADPKDSLECFAQAVRLLPGNADARMGLAMAQMITGDLQHGLTNFEARFKILGQRYNRAYVLENLPRWDGKPTDKRVLIFCEQGNGDAIHFQRYHRFVRERCPNVVTWSPGALLELFQRLEPTFPSKDGNPVGTFDVWVPNISLPLVLGMASYDQIPPAPYLTPSPELVARWTPRIKPSPRLKVGLVWQGSATNSRDALRSVPAQRLKALAELPVDLYSLQVPSKEKLDFCDDIAAEIQTFDDTAAIISQLDLVISVDTAVAHLAGALGKPVWILLNFHGEWRWLIQREDTPWYPSARLFRQPELGNWNPVMQRVYDTLGALARQHVAKAS